MPLEAGLGLARLLLRLLPGDAGMPEAAPGLFGDWEATYCITCSSFGSLGCSDGGRFEVLGKGLLWPWLGKRGAAGSWLGDAAPAELLGRNSKE